MKTFIICIAALLWSFVLYSVAILFRHAVDDIDSIERNTSIIRATLAPTPMRATVVLPEESPKEITL